MATVTQKQEILDWLTSVNDENILNEIIKIKKQSTINFNEEFKKGITSDELKKRISNHIKTLPWKK